MKRMSVMFLLLVGSAAAQLNGEMIVRQVRVQLDFVNGACDDSTHATLMGRGGPVAEAVTNDRCVVEFHNVPAGSYQLSVSGKGYSQTNAGRIKAAANGASDFEVKVSRHGDIDRTYGMPAGLLVSASELGVPARARKEFDKAEESFARQDFSKAVQRLNKAISIYPAYAGAYNNLGVAYSQLGDASRSHDALQKAISINNHLASAYVNLGRLSIRADDFSGAEALLTKAGSLDPNDAMALTLLAYSELRAGHLDDAIASSRKAHALRGPHAIAHQVAARALEQKGQATAAAEELELFLQEEPSGPRAESARRELADLRTTARK